MRNWRLLGLSTLVATFTAVAAVATAAPSVHPNGISWLTDRDIRKALAGKTIEGRYSDGAMFVESYDRDGSLQYFDQSRRIFGYWSITADTLCTIYDTDPTGGCFRVSRVAKNCFEFYFAARTEAAVPESDAKELRWTARGAVSGEPEACPDEASVEYHSLPNWLSGAA